MLKEILTARTKPSDKALYNIWARKLSGGWTEQEITGTLPLTFSAKAGELTDYTIYGTSAGAGEATSGTEPQGYKIPLTISDGTNSRSYDLYIGDSKLGEEEYVDYVEGKVYKRTAQLFNKDAKDTDNGYVDGEYLSGTNAITASSSYAISEYIPVLANTEYFLKNAAPSNDQYRRMVFYNSSKTGLSNIRYRDTGSPDDFSFTTPENCAFVRISFVKDFAADISLTLSSVSEYIPYLQPTDPPSPLPAITAYAGENTLSSTETVGSVSLTGKIKEVTT